VEGRRARGDGKAGCTPGARKATSQGERKDGPKVGGQLQAPRGNTVPAGMTVSGRDPGAGGAGRRGRTPQPGGSRARPAAAHGGRTASCDTGRRRHGQERGHPEADRAEKLSEHRSRGAGPATTSVHEGGARTSGVATSTARERHGRDARRARKSRSGRACRKRAERQKERAVEVPRAQQRRRQGGHTWVRPPRKTPPGRSRHPGQQRPAYPLAGSPSAAAPRMPGKRSEVQSTQVQQLAPRKHWRGVRARARPPDRQTAHPQQPRRGSASGEAPGGVTGPGPWAQPARTPRAGQARARGWRAEARRAREKPGREAASPREPAGRPQARRQQRAAGDRRAGPREPSERLHRIGHGAKPGRPTGRSRGSNRGRQGERREGSGSGLCAHWPASGGEQWR